MIFTRVVGRRSAIQGRGWRGLIALVALSGAACQASGIETAAVTPAAAWKGPDVFELPRMKVRPDTVVTHTWLCVAANGTQRGTTRLVGVRRDDMGLTEAQLEMDGQTVADLLFNDQGRLVHSRAREGSDGSRSGTLSMPLPFMLPPSVEAAFYRPLTRNRPAVVETSLGEMNPEVDTTDAQGRPVTVPLRELARRDDLKSDFKALAAQVSRLTLDMGLEYLGQTEFDGVQAAGHRVTGRLAPITIQRFEFRMQFAQVTYSDANQGVLLYTAIDVMFSVRQGAQPPVEMRMSCQVALDRAASKGI